jgi:macrolide transport system ATP-binding/permease protein
MLDTLRQDLRFGLRLLRVNPGATLTAMVSLALGIGANTAMFTIVNAALVRPLPVTAPGELALVYSGDRDAPWSVTSYPSYVDYRDRNEVFSGLAAFAEIGVSLSAEEGPALVRGAIVTGNFFDVLGVGAARGRVLTPADDRTPGAHPVVVITHELWMRELGGRADAVGSSLTINGRVYTILGVTPQGFRGTSVLDPVQLFVPMMMQAAVRPPRGGFSGEMDPNLLTRRESGWLTLVGRLRPGMTMERARAGLATLSTQMASAYPELAGLLISPYPLSRVDPRAWPLLRNAAALLMGVVGLVLLIAAANVANLLLARAVARRREIALRLALGGSRVRLVRQLLTETLLLAIGGAALGVLSASWSLQALTQAIPSTGIFSFHLELPIDWRVAAFTTGVTVLAALFAGLAPALQASNPGLLPALKDADPLGSGGRLRLRGQRALVVAQLALSLMLLVIAGLFLKSLWRAQGLSPGFDVDSVATANLQIDLLRYTRVQGQQFYRDVVERAMALPGVSAASVARVVPLSGGGRTTPLQIEGQVVPDAPPGGGAPRRPGVATNVVGTRYFETMGIGLVAGRDFSGRDAEGAPRAVVVNESFVARYFPGERALGKRIALGGATDPTWREIVGIVRDSAYRTIAELPTPFVYQPVAQQHETGMTLLVRTRHDPALIVGELRRMLVSLEPNAPVTSVQPLSALVSSALYPARMGARLMAIFGIIAVSLAAVGLYGVAAFAVSRRTREMGIRTALGARQRDLMTLVLRESLTVVSIGIALGAIGAGLLAQLVRGFLYGISPTDPLVFGSVALLLALVMLGATGLPARRASKTDPLTALRVE